MATVAELRGNETLVTTVSPIAEPLNASSIFRERLKRFGDHYNLNNESHLYRYLVALCGDAGAGSIKKEMLLPRLKEKLEATHFYDLDRLYGDTLALPRLSPELYTYDPENEVLTAEEWAEVRSKDAEYRYRCLLWMRAIIEGGSVEGMRLAGQAATGIECDIFERYKYLDNTSGVLNIGVTGSRNEFVLQPRTVAITEQEKRRIMRLIDKLRPVNTVPYVQADAPLRSLRTIRALASSSDYFYVNRYVTGNPNIVWPAVDLSKAYWIESNVEKEAPLFAFMERREAVTYLSIIDVQASSEHVGWFNQDQRNLFAHLIDSPDHFYQYRADRSYARNIAPVNLTVPWQKAERGITIVNNYYPLGYFAEANVDSFVTPPQEQFWASEEKDAGESDSLTFDFGRVRPLNFIDFEISQKPIEFTIEYDDNGEWKPVVVDPGRPVTMEVDYLPSVANPWHYFEVYFQLVQTQKVRLTFTRGTRHFPTEESVLFQWSIEIRGARFIHSIADESNFVADTGTDVLGNTFRTELETRPADNVIDPSGEIFWQSQPNPSRNAVEALYFDLRTDPQIGTMGYLDTLVMDELDERSMAEMALYHEDGQVIDEVYIDPVTYGPDMHFYYSNDDTPEWDNKLWTPIPRHYSLMKGYHALPQPTRVRYFKIEFSNLTPYPYQTIDYPTPRPIRFRRYPTWVKDYFATIYSSRPVTPDQLEVVERVVIDPLSFGFRKVNDRLVSNYEAERIERTRDTDSEVKGYIDDVINSRDPGLRTEVEEQINFRSPLQWQADLVALLDSDRALSRVALLPRSDLFDTGWTVELGIPLDPLPVEGSTLNQTEAIAERQEPTLWFPRRARHNYQIVEAVIANKVAYFAAVKRVEFHRRNYTVQHDEAVYSETLDDTAHIISNDFVQDQWRYIIEE